MTDDASDPVPAEVRHTQVLVPLDGFKFAEAALPVAVALAERLGAQVSVVTVTPDAAAGARIQTDTVTVLDELGIQASRFTLMAGDDPVQGIERRADELGSALVCMSTQGHGRFAGAVIGSVARGVLERFRKPIIAVGVPDERHRPFGYIAPEPLAVRRLVLCVDSSSASEAVLPAACGWASALEMALTILTIAEPAPPALRREKATYGRYGTDPDPASYVNRLVTRWRGCATDVTGDVVYDPISPASGLRTYLDRGPAGLVAVVTNAREGWRRVALGDTASNIVRIAGVPVLVMPVPAP